MYEPRKCYDVSAKSKCLVSSITPLYKMDAFNATARICSLHSVPLNNSSSNKEIVSFLNNKSRNEKKNA